MPKVLEQQLDILLSKGYTLADITRAIEAMQNSNRASYNQATEMVAKMYSTEGVTLEETMVAFSAILNRIEPYGATKEQEVGVILRPIYRNGMSVKDYIEILYSDKGVVKRYYSLRVKQ